jgi:hypothetical protein
MEHVKRDLTSVFWSTSGHVLRDDTLIALGNEMVDYVVAHARRGILAAATQVGKPSLTRNHSR